MHADRSNGKHASWQYGLFLKIAKSYEKKLKLLEKAPIIISTASEV
jgi:hypothetical protein